MNAAWHGAMFGRAAKPPSLASALGDKPKDEVKSNDQLLSDLRAMKRSGIGIKIRKID